MKIKFILIFFIASQYYAQKTDSLFNLLMSVHNHNHEAIHSVEEEHIKCGFALQVAIKNNFEKFTKAQQLQIKSILDRSELQTSIISPKGFFRIHYDTTGTNIPSYDGLTIEKSVREVAIAFDSAYTFEVEYLGYPPPPVTDYYNIYIKNIGSLYGQTVTEDFISDEKYTSYIELHNSMSWFYTKGIKAVKVTAAHEFHHAIQIGNYMFPRTEDIYYAELTSTAFEEFVYDDINDYYHYMLKLFNYPYKKLEEHDGYDLALWNIFLYEKFKDENPMLAHNIIKKSWEYLVEDRAIIALAKAISFYGYTFKELFSEFSVWLYFTNNRAIEGKYFEEAKFYPLVRPTNKYNLNDNIMPITCLTKPTSINYFSFINSKTEKNDTIVSIFANTDVLGSVGNSAGTNINFILTEASISEGVRINQDLNYYVKLTSDNKNYISDSYVINNKLAAEFVPQTEKDFVYPQPFNYAEDENLHFPTYNDKLGEAELFIYSSNMELVFQGKVKIPSSGNTVVTWNALDNNNKKLGSGVYVYVTRGNYKIKKGKFVILNK